MAQWRWIKNIIAPILETLNRHAVVSAVQKLELAAFLALVLVQRRARPRASNDIRSVCNSPSIWRSASSPKGQPFSEVVQDPGSRLH
jgi:hypothetical protein